MDALRPAVWNRPDVKYWYAQNMLLYVREETLSDYPALADRPGLPLRVVHPGLYLQTVRRFPPELSAKRLVHFLGRLGRELHVSRVRRRLSALRVCPRSAECTVPASHVGSRGVERHTLCGLPSSLRGIPPAAD